MSLHTAFTYNQIAGTKEIFHQRVPMLNELQRSFNLKFISLNLTHKYTHLYTLAFTNTRGEVFVHTVFFLLEQTCSRRCALLILADATKALETRYGTSKTTVKAQTLQTTTD